MFFIGLLKAIQRHYIPLSLWFRVAFSVVTIPGTRLGGSGCPHGRYQVLTCNKRTQSSGGKTSVLLEQEPPGPRYWGTDSIPTEAISFWGHTTTENLTQGLGLYPWETHEPTEPGVQPWEPRLPALRVTVWHPEGQRGRYGPHLFVPPAPRGLRGSLVILP